MIRGISFGSGEAILHLYYPCTYKNVIRIPFLVPDIKNESKILKDLGKSYEKAESSGKYSL